jgi:hypothetical protein
MTEIITSSRLRAFHACQRLHHIRYHQGFAPLEERDTAAFGTLIHHALEAWWLAWKEGGRPEGAMMLALSEHGRGVDMATMAKAELLMSAYDLRWAPNMGEWEVLAVEVPFECDLTTPDGMEIVYGARRAGKIDAIVRRRSDGAVFSVEHKTTGADLSPGSGYWSRLRMDSQVSFYFDGAASLGYELQGCIYDVLVRPDHRPLKATPVEQRKYTRATKDKPSRLYAGQREEDETFDDFKARMAEDIAASPDAYLQRTEVVRLESELFAARTDVYDASMLIMHAKEWHLAPRNVDQCLRLYGAVCPFLDVCSGMADLADTHRFKRLPDVHPELTK